MSKHYDYYITDAETKDAMVKKFDSEIGSKRSDTLQKLLDDTGAIAWTEHKSWGSTSIVVSKLAFELDHELVGAPHMLKPKYDYFKGKRVALTCGKQNKKDGVIFNKIIGAANKILLDTTTYPSWLVEEFKIMRTGFGDSTGFGTKMISTYGGSVGAGLGFAIPNTEGKHGQVEIPACFKKITYGEWYDLIEGK